MIDLHEGVAEIFLDAQHLLVLRAHKCEVKRLFRRWAWIRFQMAQDSAKRCAARVVRADARPPCPHCGAVVTRGVDAPRGKPLPKYCTPKCMRAARFARWWAKNGDKRNNERRKTDRKSPKKAAML